MSDKLSEQILKIVESATEPLETQEIVGKLKGETRAKVVYRLNLLRGEGKIRGKSIGAGKGNWVWWSLKSFV